MELGIDSFASLQQGASSRLLDPAGAMADLLARIERADQVGLDSFGVGEHHRPDAIDAAHPLILAAGAARTQRIRLSSAVTVLSAADPVRVFQAFATLDLLSGGRAEIVAGRGSSVEAFPLFGFNLAQYDALFSEKLDLLLTIRQHEYVTWAGQFRPALINQPIFPRPVQPLLPVWLGVGGSPDSFVRAGTLGLPLMMAAVGGEPARLRPLVELYRQAAAQAGHAPDRLRVGLHALGYVAPTSQQAVAEYYPGYVGMMTKVGKERGWGPMTKQQFDTLRGPKGALLLGSPAQVAEKILAHSEALGGLDRVTIQTDGIGLAPAKLLESIELLGTTVKPLLQKSEV